MLLVKPGMAYLDIVRQTKDKVSRRQYINVLIKYLDTVRQTKDKVSIQQYINVQIKYLDTGKPRTKGKESR